MHNALKPSFFDGLAYSSHCDEEPYNIKFCVYLSPAHCDIGIFDAH